MNSATENKILLNEKRQRTREWALILGASSGLGLATAKKLAKQGFNILIVHRDRRADMEHIQNQFNAIENCGVKFKNFNADALNPEKRVEIIAQIKSMLPPEEKIKILVHSIAKGHLKPMHSTSESELEHQDFMLTIEAMGISLYDWTKALVTANLFSADTRILLWRSIRS